MSRGFGDREVEVQPWTSGVDFWADLLIVDGRELGVLRSPRHELLETSYEGVVDFGAVLEVEGEALRRMAVGGVPVPEVLAVHRAAPAGGPSWMLQQRVHDDTSAEVPRRELGRMTRLIHDIQPTSDLLSPPAAWADTFWRRLEQRLRAAAPYCDGLDVAVIAGVSGLLEGRASAATSLLHMDLRSANICVQGTRIVAIIDAANCVVGDPLLELGRIRAYGYLDEEFLAGYGRTGWSPADRALLDVYELDTAALLTVVAREEIDAPELHARQRDRVLQLQDAIVGT